MIKRLQTPEEISILFSTLPSQWIQWLTENCTNPKIYIIAEFDNDLVGYVIALDSVFPPISDYFAILFDGKESNNSIDELKIYAKQKSAKLLVIAVKEVTKKLKEAGFEQVSINMGIKI
ncbi:hypothetical protein KA005_23080 [bacterium]|nr:hypothetical protein [bacterium]